MKKQTTKQKITINVFISTFSNSDQRFKNVIFIDLTTVSKIDFEYITKRNIKQSFNDVSSIDDLIDQSAKQNRNICSLQTTQYYSFKTREIKISNFYHIER